jgi:general secretion pathway protein H
MQRSLEAGGVRDPGAGAALRPSVRSAPGHPATGFSLIELIVVLAIAGLIMAVTPPMLSSAMPGLQLKSTARQVAAGLRFARARAVAQRTEVVLTLDLEARSVTISGRDGSLSIPDDLDVELVSAVSELEDESLGRIRFFPDGTSTGGRITLGYRGNGYDLDVDWLTGRVSIAAAEVPEG